MQRKCNKCKGKQSLQVACTRCNGTGMMNRITKNEKRQRKLDKFCSIKE